MKHYQSITIELNDSDQPKNYAYKGISATRQITKVKSQNIEIRNQNKRTWDSDWHWAWFSVGQLKHEVLSLDFSLDVKDFLHTHL